MKKTIIFLSLIILSLFSIKAQDLGDQDFIIQKTSDFNVILCKIIKVTTDTIFYNEKHTQKSISIAETMRYKIHGQPSVKNTTKTQESPPILTAQKSPLELNKEGVKYSDELNFMRGEMLKCHKEFRNGLLFVAVGSLVEGIDFIPAVYNNSTFTVTKSISIASMVCSLTGVILIIDSHKHIKRAGVGVSKNGLTVNYVF